MDTPSAVEIVKKETPFKAYLQIDHYLLRHALFGGGWSDVMSREVIERGHVSAVLPYDPAGDRLVLTQQFRPGALTAKDSGWLEPDSSPWLIECVAGIIDDGETPETVARRESVEEAGLEVTDLHPIYHYFSSPGCMSESVFLFCGRVDAEGAGGVFGLAHEHEDIRVFTATPEEAFAMVDDGRITNSMTMIALLWFRLNRDMVRKKWLER